MRPVGLSPVEEEIRAGKQCRQRSKQQGMMEVGGENHHYVQKD